MVAEWAPVASGENTVLMAQVAFTASFVQPEEVMVNSVEFVPPRAMEEIFRVTLPELVRVMVCEELEVPCVVAGKLRLFGVKVTPEVEVRPVPLSAADCGVPGALSETRSMACRVPAAVGVKVMLTEQVLPGLSAAGD